MHATVISLNVGTPIQQRRGGPLTGIDKRPVTSIEVRDPGARSSGFGSGVVDDAVMNRKHHGGSSKAVYAFAREELDWWEAELGVPLPNGVFGENLTTVGVVLEDAVVGSRWQVGDEVVLEVAGPRIPCRTFADKMKVPRWVERFSTRKRAGAYFAVASPGTITAGAAITQLSRPEHGMTVNDVWDAKLGDDEVAGRILELGILDRLNHGRLQRQLDRRRATSA